MQVDLTTRKLKALARRLEQDLALTGQQRRKTLDSLARGFGYDGFPALKAAAEAETRQTARGLEAAPDEALTAELRARGNAVVIFSPADVEDFVDLQAQSDWLTRNRGKLEDHLVSEGNETLMTFAQMDGVLKDDEDGEDGPDGADPAALRAAIARRVRKGVLEGDTPDWQVVLDDPDDADLRELAAEGIENGKNRDSDLDTWRLDCHALDTQADDPDLVRETVAGLIREGYTSGHYPHWTLHLGSDAAEDRESLLEHIASLIADGYTSGYHPRWWIECSVIA